MKATVKVTTSSGNKIYTHKCLACEQPFETLLYSHPVMGPKWDIPVGFIHDTPECLDKGRQLVEQWNSEIEE